MPKKILIVTDDAGESFEVLYAQQRFLEAGYQPVIAASHKKVLHGIIHDFDPEWDTYVEKQGYLLHADVPFGQVRAADYRAVLLAGGRAPEFLRQNEKLLKIVRDMHEAGRWIFCIGHGIQILLAAGLGRGRKLTSYKHGQPDVKVAGGHWVNEPSVVDGHIISAQTWDCHAEFYRHIFAALEGK